MADVLPFSVSLRKQTGDFCFDLREVQVNVFPNRWGDIASLEVGWGGPYAGSLPCAAEITANLEELRQGRGTGNLVLRGLPRPRRVKVAIEHPDVAAEAIYVRLERPEPVDFTFDMVGDGSEQVEYTYDGRMLGIRLTDPHNKSGILLRRSVVPRRAEIAVRLRQLGYRVRHRPYLDRVNVDRPVRIPTGPPPGMVWPKRLAVRSAPTPPDFLLRGKATIETEAPMAGKRDLRNLYGDGRVIVRRDEKGRLSDIDFYGLWPGVDLSGIPERADIEPILKHHGVPING